MDKTLFEKSCEEQLRKTELDLANTRKELNSFYEISQLMERRGIRFEDIIRSTVELLPQAMSNPELACARIVFGDKQYKTSNFKKTKWRLARDITQRLNQIGSVEIYYLKQIPVSQGAIFRDEERKFVEMISWRMGRIYARKQAEIMLSQSEERYHSLFENSRDAIYITSREGVFLDANQATLDLFGYTRDELIGMNVVSIYEKPEDRKIFQEKIESEGAVRNYEIRMRKKDGTVMDSLVTFNVRADAEGGIIGYQGIIRDITESKRSQLERERLISELTEALEKIKTLRGLIPICARCKKIRDDTGYWNQLEEYIEKYSDAVFSHGLCPECQKLFEEED